MTTNHRGFYKRKQWLLGGQLTPGCFFDWLRAPPWSSRQDDLNLPCLFTPHPLLFEGILDIYSGLGRLTIISYSTQNRELTMALDQGVAHALNAINRANLRGAVPEHMWGDFLDQYFVMEEEARSGSDSEEDSEEDSVLDGSQAVDAEDIDDPLVEVDPTLPVIEEVRQEVIEDEDTELQKVLNFR